MTPPTVQFIPGGETLIIHDAFNGTGYLDGRTPDTVDNGNTWSTSASGDYVISSGYAESAVGIVNKYGLIQVGSANARIEMESRADWVYTAQNYYQGLSWHNDTTAGTVGLLRLDYNRLLKIENGINTVLATSPTQNPRNTPIYWDVQISPSSISYDITYSGGTIYSGSFTPSVLPSASVPMGLYTYRSHPPSGGPTYISDFKVYT